MNKSSFLYREKQETVADIPAGSAPPVTEGEAHPKTHGETPEGYGRRYVC